MRKHTFVLLPFYLCSLFLCFRWYVEQISVKRDFLSGVTLLFFSVYSISAQAFCPHCQQEPCRCHQAPHQVDIHKISEPDGGNEDLNQDKDQENVDRISDIVRSLGPYKANMAESVGTLSVPGINYSYREGIQVTPLLTSNHSDKHLIEKMLALIKEAFLQLNPNMVKTQRYGLWLALHLMPIDDIFSLLMYLKYPDDGLSEWIHSFESPFELIAEQKEMAHFLKLIDEEIRLFMAPVEKNLNSLQEALTVFPLNKSTALSLTYGFVNKLVILRSLVQSNNISHCAMVFDSIVRFGHSQVAVQAVRFIGEMEDGNNLFRITEHGDVIIIDSEQIITYIRMLFTAQMSGNEEASKLYLKFIKALENENENLLLEVTKANLLTVKKLRQNVSSCNQLTKPTEEKISIANINMLQVAVKGSVIEIIEAYQANPDEMQKLDSDFLELTLQKIEKSVQNSMGAAQKWDDLDKTKKELLDLLSVNLTAESLIAITSRLLNLLGKVRANDACLPAVKTVYNSGQENTCTPFFVFENPDHLGVVPALLQKHRIFIEAQSDPRILWSYANLVLLLTPPSWEYLQYILLGIQAIDPMVNVNNGALLKFLPEALDYGQGLTVALTAMLQSVIRKDIPISAFFETTSMVSLRKGRNVHAMNFMEALAKFSRNLSDQRQQSSIRSLTPLVEYAESGFVPVTDLILEIIAKRHLKHSGNTQGLWNRIEKLTSNSCAESIADEQSGETLGLEDKPAADRLISYLALIDEWNPNYKKKQRKGSEKKNLYIVLYQRKAEAIEHFVHIIQQDKKGKEISQTDRERLAKLLNIIPESEVDPDDLLISQFLVFGRLTNSEDVHKLIRLYLVDNISPGNISKVTRLLLSELEKQKETGWLTMAANENIDYRTGLLLVAPSLQKPFQSSVLAIVEGNQFIATVHNAIVRLNDWYSNDAHLPTDQFRKAIIYLFQKIGVADIQARLLAGYIKPGRTGGIIVKWLDRFQELIGDSQIPRKAKYRITTFQKSLESHSAQITISLNSPLAEAIEKKPSSRGKKKKQIKPLSTSGQDQSPASIKGDNKNIHVECPVCFCEFSCSDNDLNPRPLACGHSFCKPCLKKMENNQQIICPICRKAYHGSADNVAINFLALKLMSTQLSK